MKMRNIIPLLGLLLSSFPVIGQEEEPATVQDTLLVNVHDEKYVEDQFYIGIAYGLLTKKPEDVSQNNVSYSIFLGFIKDLPLNKRRNVALGVGVGYALEAYFSNLQATLYNEGNSRAYSPLFSDFTDYKRNKFGFHMIEFPMELRWRTSTIDNYRFWRVNLGMKLGYAFGGKSKFITENSNIKFSNPDVRDLQYGVYLVFGYNTFNFYVDYQVTGIFDDGVFITDGPEIKMRPLKVGLIFYVL